jgi:4-hydroxy-tetrahydrodipicolinate synthase
MATPFDEEGELDLDGAADLARHLVAAGNEGLVVAGSTGEGSSLGDEEKLELFSRVAAAVNVPVLAGTSSPDTRHSVELTRRASSTGVAGILATTPAYARPSQAGLRDHLVALAEATDLPVMLYDIPVRTGRKIKAATTHEILERCPNVLALKDASGEVVAAGELAYQTRGRLDLYSGDDSLTLAFLALGAVGVVSVAGHWATPELRRLVDAVVEGDLDTAREMHHRLVASFEVETSEEYPNPVPTKAALRCLGWPGGECRAPLGRGDAVIEERVGRVIADLRVRRG